jgi:diacylglycerol kinase family enzyme
VRAARIAELGASPEPVELDGDGALEVVAVAAGPRPGLVGLAYRLRRGGLTRHRRAHRRRCPSAVIRVPDGTEWNVDGELIRGGTARFRGEARAFRLVVA